ncbi:putative transcription factor Hap3/NF-YB family [Helianthus annuus]|nr:putative transcription factor Hap3/NF-YB family [Helianthus annuus]
MDIEKLLEEEEDETMHSGADVAAFTAALNRDIVGDNNNNNNNNTSHPPPPTAPPSSAAALSSNHTPSQVFQQWQQQQLKPPQSSAAAEHHHHHHHPPDPTPPPPDNNNKKEDDSQSQSQSHLQQQQQRMQRGQMPTSQSPSATARPAGKQVPFALLLPVIEPQLDKDRAMQLQGLYVRLRTNSINKEEFVRHMRSLVGDHMLKMAVYKLQQGQIPAKPSMDNNAQKQRLLEHQSDSHKSSNVNPIKQERDQQPFPMQGLGKQHMPFPQPSFPNYGPPNMNTFKQQQQQQQTHDLQMRQGPVQTPFTDMKRLHGGSLAHFTSSNSGHWQPSMHKDMPSMGYAKQEPLDHMNDQQHKSQLGQTESSKDETFEMMSSRPGFSSSMNKSEPMSITAQLERQNMSAGNSSLASGSNAKTPPKKPTVGQKKPLEAPVSSLSKKQKVSGAFSDQSIEQLNDVTAVSGVNLREEEEQLFSGSKEDSRVSEASRKVVQEEEERLILQKTPLQKKLSEIMAKCGVKNRSNDVERCLSLCVEERMRGLISNLIRLSKQRVDIEKPRHQTVVTSDVRKQIMSMNQKAREEWEKKQADAEKLQRADEPEGSGDGEDGRGRSFKVNKEEDDKQRTTAANVAARAAVGGDDMLSKWQLMAEQARQKREGGPDASQPSAADVGPKPQSATERNSKDNPDAERMTTLGAITANPGPVRKITRNQELVKGGSIPRTITVKDVISVLGREIQMSRSTLIYRLYEKVRSDSLSEH